MVNLEELDKAIEQKLYPNSTCEYLECCQKGFECENPMCFYRLRVGAKYDEAKIKILIVGQEDVKPADGSVKNYKVCEPATLKDAGYNKHFLRTYYTVAQLLLENNIPIGYRKEDLKDYEKLRHYFAQTNYYKCVFSDTTKRTDKKHTKQMKKNCSQKLIEEIKLIKPDVVILQGKDHATFWESVKPDSEIPEKIVKNGNKSYKQGLYSTNIFGKTTYIVDSYHPTSRRIWDREDVLNGFIEILNVIKNKFID